MVASELRLGTPPWVLDLLALSVALCAIAALSFVPVALLAVPPALLGLVALLGVRAVLLPGPATRAAVRAIAVLLCLTVVLLPLGVAILVGLARARPGVWRYGPAPRRVAPLLLAAALAWAALDLALIAGADRTLVPAASFLAAIALVGAGGVLLGAARARPIAGAAALLTALTGVGLPLAIPALVGLWRGCARAPLDAPHVPELPGPARYRASSVFTVVTAVACAVVYLGEPEVSSLGYALIGVGPPPTLVRLLAVNGPAIARGEVWRIVTAGYLHAGVIHLALNMFALIVAGLYVERRYGRGRTAVIYLGSLAGGNLVAAVLSAPGSYTVGASGAIMGLFAGMVVVGARFRSERDSLVLAAGVVLATLIYGMLHAGVSNAAHVGGLVAGLWLASTVGTDPAWTAVVERREWDELAASERDRREAIHHVPAAAVVADPANRRVLRMSAAQRLRWWALAAVFPLLLVGDLVHLGTLGRPPTGAELGFAGLAVLMALPQLVIVLMTFGRLELTAHGFRQVTPLMPVRPVSWIDVDGGFFFPTAVSNVKFVGYTLTPAAQTGRFLAAATQRVIVYGMPAEEQAALMADWYRRWT